MINNNLKKVFEDINISVDTSSEPQGVNTIEESLTKMDEDSSNIETIEESSAILEAFKQTIEEHRSFTPEMLTLMEKLDIFEIVKLSGVESLTGINSFSNNNETIERLLFSLESAQGSGVISAFKNFGNQLERVNKFASVTRSEIVFNIRKLEMAINTIESMDDEDIDIKLQNGLLQNSDGNYGHAPYLRFNANYLSMYRQMGMEFKDVISKNHVGFFTFSKPQQVKELLEDLKEFNERYHMDDNLINDGDLIKLGYKNKINCIRALKETVQILDTIKQGVSNLEQSKKQKQFWYMLGTFVKAFTKVGTLAGIVAGTVVGTAFLPTLGFIGAVLLVGAYGLGWSIIGTGIGTGVGLIGGVYAILTSSSSGIKQLCDHMNKYIIQLMSNAKSITLCLGV